LREAAAAVALLAASTRRVVRARERLACRRGDLRDAGGEVEQEEREDLLLVGQCGSTALVRKRRSARAGDRDVEITEEHAAALVLPLRRVQGRVEGVMEDSAWSPVVIGRG